MEKDLIKAKKYLSEQGYGTGTNYTTNLVAVLLANYAAAPPPASEGEIAKEMIEACKIALHTLDSIDFTRLPGTASKRLQSVIDKYATLPTREPEVKEKFAVRFSEWLMIQCDYKNHCVWEYQGEEYTQQELIEIFKRNTPSLPTQSITN